MEFYRADDVFTTGMMIPGVKRIDRRTIGGVAIGQERLRLSGLYRLLTEREEERVV
jgi:hypothetical protein